MFSFILQQNMRTLAKYYTRITMSRLSELLDLPAPDTESVVARLAVEKMIYAKMDRPAGTVTFEEPKKTEGVLNEWASDVNKLMVRRQSTYVLCLTCEVDAPWTPHRLSLRNRHISLLENAQLQRQQVGQPRNRSKHNVSTSYYNTIQDCNEGFVLC